MSCPIKTISTRLVRAARIQACSAQQLRTFHCSASRSAVKPFLLADVGEGITECQVVQWFVQPGARVEEFDRICEVQSDKASVEITSPFAGVITKLHYETDDMAITGKPLLEIDTEDDAAEHVDAATKQVEVLAESSSAAEPSSPAVSIAETTDAVEEQTETIAPKAAESHQSYSLATPAVRHLLKELSISIEDVSGTGKDGRVLREDVLKHRQDLQHSTTRRSEQDLIEKRTPLTPVQSQMFKTMSRSLSIPHFLYTCSADMSKITETRRMIEASGATRVTAFAFILKAVSIALKHHQLLNASLDLSDTDKPALIYRPSHDFGIAIDTPSGLLVPVLRGVQDLSIEDIAQAVQDISSRARNSKLTPSDFGKASFTLSNIGAIGGGVVSPVISEPQIAIVGIGRSKLVPAFDSSGELYKREELVLSWSADHRVVDGAECARCAERVRNLLESPATMMLAMR